MVPHADGRIEASGKRQIRRAGYAGYLRTRPVACGAGASACPNALALTGRFALLGYFALSGHFALPGRFAPFSTDVFRNFFG